MRMKRPDYSENIYQEFSCENLSNFFERCKKERQDFYEVFQSGDKLDLA